MASPPKSFHSMPFPLLHDPFPFPHACPHPDFLSRNQAQDLELVGCVRVPSFSSVVPYTKRKEAQFPSLFPLSLEPFLFCFSYFAGLRLLISLYLDLDTFTTARHRTYICITVTEYLCEYEVPIPKSHEIAFPLQDLSFPYFWILDTGYWIHTSPPLIATTC